MAIVSVTGPILQRSIGRSTRQGLREYTLLYVVKTNDPDDGQQTVLNATGIPDYDDTYAFGNDTDTEAYLQFKDADRTSDGAMYTWIVTCLFSNEADLNFDGGTNPLLHPPEIEWDAIEYTGEATVDIAGNKLLNSALDLIRGIEEDNAILIYRVARNEASYSPSLALAYRNALNSDTFKGAPPGFAKMKPIRSRQLRTSGLVYWNTQYEVYFNTKGWKQKILDSGFTILVAPPSAGDPPVSPPDPAYLTWLYQNGKRQGIRVKTWDSDTGKKGAPTLASEPQLLNGFGDVLDVGQAPVELDYELAPSLPFNIFNLP